MLIIPLFSAAEMYSCLSRSVSIEGSVLAENCSSGNRPDCNSASVSFPLAVLNSRAHFQVKHTSYFLQEKRETFYVWFVDLASLIYSKYESLKLRIIKNTLLPEVVLIASWMQIVMGEKNVLYGQVHFLLVILILVILVPRMRHVLYIFLIFHLNFTSFL